MHETGRPAAAVTYPRKALVAAGFAASRALALLAHVLQHQLTPRRLHLANLVRLGCVGMPTAVCEALHHGDCGKGHGEVSYPD